MEAKLDLTEDGGATPPGRDAAGADEVAALGGAGGRVHVSGYPAELFVRQEETRDYVCPICTDICREAVETPCAHLFCDTCLSLAVEVKMECPLDHKRLVAGSVHKAGFVRRKVLNMTVRCPNSGVGCPHTGPLGQLDAHMAACAHKPASCTQCAANVAAGELERHHREQCPCRLVPCEHCGRPVEWDELREHCDRACEAVALPCPNRCGAAGSTSMRRPDLAEHLRADCPLQEVRCRYAEHGCTQPIQRKEVARHVAAAASYHLDLVEQHFRAEMARMRDEQAALGLFYMRFRHADDFVAALDGVIAQPAADAGLPAGVVVTGLSVFCADAAVTERALVAMSAMCGADGASSAAGDAAPQGDPVVPRLCRAGVVPAAVEAMRAHTDSAAVQEAALRLVRKMATSAVVKEAVQRGVPEFVPAVLAAMGRHAGELSVQRDALGVLLNMAVNDAIEARIGELGAVRHVVAAMDRFADNPNVQQLGCHCLFHLTFNGENKERLVAGGALPRLIRALRRHKDHESTAYYAVRALTQLSKRDRYRVKLLRLGLVPLAEYALATHSSHKDMQRKARALLARLRNRGTVPPGQIVPVGPGGSSGTSKR